MSRRKRSLCLVVTAPAVVGLLVLGSGVKESAQLSLFSHQPAYAQASAEAIAQRVKPGDVWQQVYQQLPDLPLENQYVNKESGQVDPDNTLVARLIRYHVYVKGRPTEYRLDWKLTLADYLGANELIQEAVYPGYDTLRQNPIEGDRAVIGRLNRKQRDALVQTLVSVFNPNYPAQSAPASNSSPQPSTAPSPTARPSSPQPRPGDAQLLMP